MRVPRTVPPVPCGTMGVPRTVPPIPYGTKGVLGGTWDYDGRFGHPSQKLHISTCTYTPESTVGVLNRIIAAIVGVWFGAGTMFVFLALVILCPNDILTGFVMTTKTCQAAKLDQRR